MESEPTGCEKFISQPIVYTYVYGNMVYLYKCRYKICKTEMIICTINIIIFINQPPIDSDKHELYRLYLCRYNLYI